jgi:hypothetical protein
MAGAGGDIAAAAEGREMHAWDLIEIIFNTYVDMCITQWMGMGHGRRWSEGDWALQDRILTYR